MKNLLVCMTLSFAALLLSVQTKASEYERHYSSGSCANDQPCPSIRVTCPRTGETRVADNCDMNSRGCFWGHTP
jgi:hypothetical protein